MRLVWLLLGLTFVGLGFLGIILPLVPTVPFMLLAAFCFARSSERLHDWILSHPQFGPPITEWRERGAISPRVKRISSISIILVLVISVLTGVRPQIVLVQAGVLMAVLVFIWSRPSE